MIDPVDRRQARGDTGGEDRLIERQQIDQIVDTLRGAIQRAA